MAQAQRQPQMQVKVLRIGIVQDGKIVQERLIKAGDPVTVGDSDKNTFAFPAATVGKRFQLFQPLKGGTYTLNFVDAMSGKISHNNGVFGLDELKTQADCKKQGDHYALALTDGSRGKVTVDGVTILFQFVPPPPEPLRAENLDFRPKLIDNEDPVFYGLLGLFSAIGLLFGVYAMNAPPVVYELETLPERFTQVVMAPPPEDNKPVEDLETPTEDGVEVQKEEASKEVQKEPKNAAEKAQRDKQNEQKVLNSSKLLMAIIGTRGESGSDQRVEDLFGEDAMSQDLDSALANVSGADIASSANLQTKNGGAGGRQNADIGDLAGASTGTVGVGSAPQTKITGNVGIGDADEDVEAGDAGSARKTVNKYKGQIKYCYDQQLKIDPTIQGRVEIQFLVKEGLVKSNSLVVNTTGSDALSACISSKVRTWRFDTTLSGDFVYPFVLAPSN